MYTILTDRFTLGEQVKQWEPFGELWQTSDDKYAIRQFAYLRFAYPGYVWSLLKDNYVVSSLELSRLARHIILEKANR